MTKTTFTYFDFRLETKSKERNNFVVHKIITVERTCVIITAIKLVRLDHLLCTCNYDPLIFTQKQVHQGDLKTGYIKTHSYLFSWNNKVLQKMHVFHISSIMPLTHHTKFFALVQSHS